MLQNPFVSVIVLKNPNRQKEFFCASVLVLWRNGVFFFEETGGAEEPLLKNFIQKIGEYIKNEV